MEAPQYKPYDDPDKLRRMYWGAGMTQEEIASAFCVSRASIQRAMVRYDITTRNPGQSNPAGGAFNTRVDGYEAWSVHDCGESRTIYVHQLVAVADGADPHKVFGNQEYDVHHKNGIKWDNRPGNLELLTASEHREIHRKRGDYPKNYDYTDDDLVEWLDTFVEYFGFIPKASDLYGWPGPHPLTYKNRFGSWTAAIKEAGYTPRSER